MKIKIKDPGSALTHFIAMLGAGAAAAVKGCPRTGPYPLCGAAHIYRQYDPSICREYDLPYTGYLR